MTPLRGNLRLALRVRAEVTTEPAGSVWPQVNGAEEGITSITHYELLQAGETNRTGEGRRLPDPGVPAGRELPLAAPIDRRFCDDRSVCPARQLRYPQAANSASARANRRSLPSPSDLEARVSTAVTMATASLQVEAEPRPCRRCHRVEGFRSSPRHSPGDYQRGTSAS